MNRDDDSSNTAVCGSDTTVSGSDTTVSGSNTTVAAAVDGVLGFELHKLLEDGGEGGSVPMFSDTQQVLGGQEHSDNKEFAI